MSLDAAQLRRYLLEQLLPTWAEYGPDRAHGGCHLFLEPDMTPSADSDFRRLVVQTRHLYSMSVAVRMGAGAWASAATEAALGDLERIFRDRKHGGWYYTTEPDGTPLDRKKDSYAHAFALLSLATCHSATGHARPLELAEETLGWIDAHLAAPQHGGYHEGRAEDWGAPEVAVPRRQNPHMHLLEAFLVLHEVTGREDVLGRARAIIELFHTRFYDPQTRTLTEYFASDWSRLSDPDADKGALVEPGHHFEWVWLLFEYARQSGDREVLAEANALYHTALEHGLIADGRAAINTIDCRGQRLEEEQRAWPQTEYMKALVARWESLADEEARDRLERALAYTFESRIVEPHGAWRERLGADGSVIDPRYFTATVYHIVLALTEVIRVLEKPREALT